MTTTATTTAIQCGEFSSIEAVIAKALGIEEREVDEELSYQSIPQWDSLGHVSLMVALERALDVKIEGDCRALLGSVKAIREFCAERTVRPAEQPDSRREGPVLHRGLVGVCVDRSLITRIDGENGTLEYRGYSIHDLAAHATFEETAYLLIHGELPDGAALASFSTELTNARVVPPLLPVLMRSLSHAHPMEALRTGISALGALDPESSDHSPAATLRKGVRLIAQVPLLVAIHHAARSRQDVAPTPRGLSHASWLLHILLAKAPSHAAVRLIDRDLIVHADHSSNASTFAARVVVGCRAGIHAAITAAMSAFEGPLHGGAAEKVMGVVDEVGSAERAASYVAERMERNQPVMGFGHRVYRTEDPRVRHLREAALLASRERGDMRGFEIITALVEAMKPYSRHGVDANVDLYAGLLYRMLGFPDDLAVPLFVVGRMAGWVAQALEQQGNNVLIRPLLHYAGPTGRRHPRAS